ncbi:uncharacterized protein LOC119102131, partial [Pollicipes pollicipes]|uniref:uncharacterized protein LOC119102131 n=1 Tax=Pollicipes pollicipes TaxID=41117 RepID=UPI0018859E5B
GFGGGNGLGGGFGGGIGRPGGFVGGGGGFSEQGFISTDGGDVTATCDENGMELTLQANAPFYGRMYTYRHYDQCSVVGRGDRVMSLRISADGGFPACGTQRFGDVMQNIVVVQFSEYVQTNFDKRYNLTCYFQGPGEAVVTSGYISASPGQLTPIIDLPAREVLDSRVRLAILYQGRPTTTIAVGDPLTFRLETQSGSNLVTDIFATNVIARDPYSGRSVELIDRYGCPTDPRLFPGLDLSRDGNGLEARFSAFKIPQSNYLLFEATVRPCRQRCRPATCAVDGREEVSFGRRRRRALPENATEELPLPDPADEPVEPQDEEIGPDIDPKDSEEYVKRLMSVFYTREELVAEEVKVPEDVCISSAEYYGLLATMVVLMVLMVLGAVLAGLWFRRSRLLAYKNQDADMTSPLPRAFSAPGIGKNTFSFLHGKRSSPMGHSFPQGSANPAYDVDGPPAPRGRKFDDPSEPIYTDPSLFERSRSLRSVSASEFGQTRSADQQ